MPCPLAGEVQINPSPPSRRPVRLADYDYAIGGSYFIAICANRKACVFGQVVRGRVHLSALGEIVKVCWRAIPKHFPEVMLDESIIMPNHLQGIVVQWGDAVAFAPVLKEGETREAFGAPVKASLSTIVRSFKSAVTKAARAQGVWDQKLLWQRGYHEHIIRSSEPLEEIRRYMHDNPLRWMERKTRM
jgi:REP element-mobilizing transposase RayT